MIIVVIIAITSMWEVDGQEEKDGGTNPCSNS